MSRDSYEKPDPRGEEYGSLITDRRGRTKNQLRKPAYERGDADSEEGAIETDERGREKNQAEKSKMRKKLRREKERGR